MFLKEIYYLCSIDEMPRKHIKAECSNKNGWQFVASKSDNPPNVLIIKGQRLYSKITQNLRNTPKIDKKCNTVARKTVF